VKEFLKRTLTGAVFAVVMITMIWWNIYSLAALLLFILVTGMNEFFNLSQFRIPHHIKISVISIGTFIFSGIVLSRIGILAPVNILYIIVTGIFLCSLLVQKSGNTFGKNILTIFFSYLYILLPISLTLYIVEYHEMAYNPRLLIFLFILIWVYDSFAYITGVLTGRNKILPSISPKKTWEGLIGGLIFVLGTAYILSLYIKDFTLIQWIILSVIVVIAGTTGDFFESFLKRKAGVKDSGNWLPGHGGILDRFDSFLFIVPFIFLFLKIWA